MAKPKPEILQKNQGADNKNAGMKENNLALNVKELNDTIQLIFKNQIEAKDELITRLHDELEASKEDPVQKYTDQLMRSVIKIRKDVKKTIERDSFGEMSADDLRKEYEYIFDDITDLLELQNVDSFKSSPGDMFDRSRHDAKTEKTKDPELDRKIKASLSDGYTKDGKVLVLEKVIVYKYSEEQ